MNRHNELCLKIKLSQSKAQLEISAGQPTGFRIILRLINGDEEQMRWDEVGLSGAIAAL